MLDHLFYLPEISSSRVLVDFLPYTSSDAAKIKPYGLITKTPEGRAKVKAVIKTDGQIVKQSSSLTTGERFIDAHEINGTLKIRSSKQVGTLIALGFDILNTSEKFIQKLKKKNYHQFL